MPRLSQGDIFQLVRESAADLAIVFGHIGFNEMHLRWRAFADTEPFFAHIRDPFSEIPGEPLHVPPGQYLWFVSEQENHGMTDEQLVAALDAAFQWARDNGQTRIVTNGIANIDHGVDTEANRQSDDQRARLLIRYATEHEQRGLSVELISLNDVFVRNENKKGRES